MRRLFACLFGILLLLPALGLGEPAGYVRLTIGDQVSWIPLPEEEEEPRSLHLTMEQQDGSEYLNIIEFTPDSITMTDANCDGQDCVHQGTVSLDNMETRLLWNMIVCLPHQLVLELFTPEEYARMAQEES